MGVEIICGEAREVLAGLPAGSVHTCITSPPYFGLRSYGGGPLEIGTEATPAEYVAHLVDVFAQVKRVLHPTGTLWVVIGDSYASAWPCSPRNLVGQGSLADGKRASRPPRMGAGLKEKDLIGIPWMLAFALRDDGWYLRQEVIWQKLSAMPESVGDRCTRSHETVFMLAKKPVYFYDQEAIREANSSAEQLAHNLRYAKSYAVYDARAATSGQPGNVNNVGIHSRPGSAGRNKRSVWTVGPQPLGEEHYAAFPEKLVEPMILAGTSEAGCCPRCLAPYRRVVERLVSGERKVCPKDPGYWQTWGHSTGPKSGLHSQYLDTQQQTTGWEAGCSCEAGPPIPCTTLDCFAGSGTTGLVSRKLGRSAILIELNPAYVKLAQRRIDSTPSTLFSAAVLADDGIIDAAR